MKEIKAIIQPFRLDEVREALRKVPGFPGMTVTRVEGCSSPQRHVPHGIKEELLDFSPKVRIEIVAEDAHAEGLRKAILEAAATQHVGDGIVWMTAAEAFEYVWKPGD
ncbi:P-II family nitrogen regulator [Pigmentiphaga soli]|uniref:P-II family nitrogen regulator n=1 Tax=Pigmentiphaga soli TaxID=1007095 RepID=A0ABP8H4S4_9BURK